MGDRQAFEAARDGLRANGIDIPMSIKPGTWTEPTVFEYEIAGKKTISQFWSGNPERLVARSIFRGIMKELDPDKLELLKAKEYALAQDRD